MSTSAEEDLNVWVWAYTTLPAERLILLTIWVLFLLVVMVVSLVRAARSFKKSYRSFKKSYQPPRPAVPLPRQTTGLAAPLPLPKRMRTVAGRHHPGRKP